MSDETDKVKYFQDLTYRTKRLQEIIDGINSNLVHEGYEKISSSNNKNIWAEYIEKNPEKSGQYFLIDEFMREALMISNLVNQYSENHLKNWEIDAQRREDLFLQELNHQKQERKSERIDYWILWFHKSIRWVAGFVLLIVVYSSTVWVSEQVGFVKIPVKDWFYSQGKLNTNVIPKQVSGGKISNP